MLTPLKSLPLGPVLDDLEIRPDRVRTFGDPPVAARADATHGAVAVTPGLSPETAREALLEFARRETSPDGTLLVFLEGQRSDPELARWRNALWPLAHVSRLYRMSNSRVERVDIDKTEPLKRASGLRGIVLVARRREAVLDPSAVVLKFDRNASGWNGEPGRPSYGHFRWMRRHVAEFAANTSARRILDFGCGAGWVGIEAALLSRGASLGAFDPSPEMVKLAEENARASGVSSFVGRTGFGEDPPFPASGEEPFDLVLCSGVISFASDAERWLDGLVRALAPGATLVIGDLNPKSRGMLRRRASRPLLPVREMNAWTRVDVRSALEKRGLVFEAWGSYQLSSPVPGLMHFDATRMHGLFSRPLLWSNRAATGLLASRPEWFDSWVIRLKRGSAK